MTVDQGFAGRLLNSPKCSSPGEGLHARSRPLAVNSDIFADLVSKTVMISTHETHIRRGLKRQSNLIGLRHSQRAKQW